MPALGTCRRHAGQRLESLRVLPVWFSAHGCVLRILLNVPFGTSMLGWPAVRDTEPQRPKGSPGDRWHPPRAIQNGVPRGCRCHTRTWRRQLADSSAGVKPRARAFWVPLAVGSFIAPGGWTGAADEAGAETQAKSEVAMEAWRRDESVRQQLDAMAVAFWNVEASEALGLAEAITPSSFPDCGPAKSLVTDLTARKRRNAFGKKLAQPPRRPLMPGSRRSSSRGSSRSSTTSVPSRTDGPVVSS